MPAEEKEEAKGPTPGGTLKIHVHFGLEEASAGSVAADTLDALREAIIAKFSDETQKFPAPNKLIVQTKGPDNKLHPLKNDAELVLDEVLESDKDDKYRVYVEMREETHKRARKEVTWATKVEGASAPLPTFRHALVDRQKALEALADFVIHNFQSRYSDSHKDHTMFYIPGGSRIGKTRIAFEFCHIALDIVQNSPLFKALTGPDQVLLSRAIERTAHHIFLDFNNGDAYERHFDTSQSASVRVGVRLAARCHFQVRFNTMLEACGGNFRHLGAQEVLRGIVASLIDRLPTTKDVVLVVLHFDDFNLYVDSLCKAGRNYEDALTSFKEMMNEVGTFMRGGFNKSDYRGRFVLLPIATGASAADVYYLPTTYNRAVLRLRPLGEDDNKTEDYGMAIADHHYDAHPLWHDIRNQHHFRVALSDCGGIPGYIDYLLGPEPSTETDWGSSLFSRLTFARRDDPKQALFFELDVFGGAKAAKVLIELALTRTIVHRTYSLPGGKTIGQVEAIGGLFLSPVSPEKFYVEIPFIILKAVNLLLFDDHIFPDGLLFFPTPARPWYWQDFEALHLHYLRVRTNALIDLSQLRLNTVQVRIDAAEAAKETMLAKGDFGDKMDSIMGKLKLLYAEMSELEAEQASGVPLGEVIKAHGSPTMLDKRLLLQTLRVHHEEEKFLPLKTTVATFSHNVLCHNDDGSPYLMPLMGNAFLCAENNALIDGRVAFATSAKPLLVFWKSSDVETKDGTVSVGDIEGWYHQTRKALAKFAEHYELCLFFASNRRLTHWGKKDTVLLNLFEECPNLLLVTREDFENWLSPVFSHRGLLALDP